MIRYTTNYINHKTQKWTLSALCSLFLLLFIEIFDKLIDCDRPRAILVVILCRFGLFQKVKQLLPDIPRNHLHALLHHALAKLNPVAQQWHRMLLLGEHNLPQLHCQRRGNCLLLVVLLDVMEDPLVKRLKLFLVAERAADLLDCLLYVLLVRAAGLAEAINEFLLLEQA